MNEKENRRDRESIQAKDDYFKNQTPKTIDVINFLVGFKRGWESAKQKWKKKTIKNYKKLIGAEFTDSFGVECVSMTKENFYRLIEKRT